MCYSFRESKKLFNIINKLLHKHHEISLPDCESDEELANKFSHFFSDKISRIRDGFDMSVNETYTEHDSAHHYLTDFSLASEDEVYEILSNSL